MNNPFVIHSPFSFSNCLINKICYICSRNFWKNLIP